MLSTDNRKSLHAHSSNKKQLKINPQENECVSSKLVTSFTHLLIFHWIMYIIFNDDIDIAKFVYALSRVFS